MNENHLHRPRRQKDPSENGSDPDELPIDQMEFNAAMEFVVRRFPHWFAGFRREELEPEKYEEHRVLDEFLRRQEGEHD